MMIEHHGTDGLAAGHGHPDALDRTFEAVPQGARAGTKIVVETAFFYLLDRRKIFLCRGPDVDDTHAPFL